MRLKPFEDRVLIEREEKEVKTKEGLILPDTTKERPRVGRVIEVGTDEELAEKIKVDDRVIFAKDAGEEVEFEGKKYLILSKSDILAVVR